MDVIERHIHAAVRSIDNFNTEMKDRVSVEHHNALRTDPEMWDHISSATRAIASARDSHVKNDPLNSSMSLYGAAQHYGKLVKWSLSKYPLSEGAKTVALSTVMEVHEAAAEHEQGALGV